MRHALVIIQMNSEEKNQGFAIAYFIHFLVINLWQAQQMNTIVDYKIHYQLGQNNSEDYYSRSLKYIKYNFKI